MSVLVFTPTIGDQLHAETGASIAAQKTAPEGFPPFVWIVSDHNPFPGQKVANVVAQYQHARELCLAGDFDALLTVEHDMIIPPDALAKLYATDAAVVYGVYMLRHGTPALNTWQYLGNKNLGMTLSLYPNEVRKYFKQGWGQVSGVGWGCTLIRRQVLERIEIRSTGGGDAGDLAFASDCMRSGYRLIARFDVPCGHILPDGRVLWPNETGGIVYRVYALQNVNVSVNGQTLSMIKDRYYSVPADVADDLKRGGYVKIEELEKDEDAEERQQPEVESREVAVDPKATTRGKRKVPRSPS